MRNAWNPSFCSVEGPHIYKFHALYQQIRASVDESEKNSAVTIRRSTGSRLSCRDRLYCTSCSPRQPRWSMLCKLTHRPTHPFYQDGHVFRSVIIYLSVSPVADCQPTVGTRTAGQVLFPGVPVGSGPGPSKSGRRRQTTGSRKKSPRGNPRFPRSLARRCLSVSFRYCCNKCPRKVTTAHSAGPAAARSLTWSSRLLRQMMNSERTDGNDGGLTDAGASVRRKGRFTAVPVEDWTRESRARGFNLNR